MQITLTTHIWGVIMMPDLVDDINVNTSDPLCERLELQKYSKNSSAPGLNEIEMNLKKTTILAN